VLLLHRSFQEGIIYTNVSSILVSVNPFKLLPLYTPEIMDKYRVNSREMPPHVFQVDISCPFWRGKKKKRERLTEGIFFLSRVVMSMSRD